MSLRYTKTWFLSSEIKNKVLGFTDRTRKNTVLEIGCYEGLSSVFFAEYMLDNPESTLTCVDPFMSIETNDHGYLLKNGEEANFDHNIQICKNADKITVRKITSDAFFEMNSKTFNFIYIDGCHEPEFIQRDMENAFQVLDENGIMWMDDYLIGDGQVKKIMDNFLERYADKYVLIHSGYQLAIKKCTRKIVDGFVFYNEIKMLQYRLEVLYPFVDQFIICESTLTFSGKPKELYYENNKELFSKYQDKIVHVIVDDTPETKDAWDRERHQRRCISRGFKNLADYDIISLADVDEIPNPAILELVRKGGLDQLYCLKQDMYYYNITTLFGRNWIKAKILPYSFYKTIGKEDLELCRMSFFNVAFNFGGWHLTYFGDEKFIANKLTAYSHQEHNTDHFINEEFLLGKIKNGINLFDDRKFEHIPIDQNKNLPPKYELLLSGGESQLREAII